MKIHKTQVDLMSSAMLLEARVKGENSLEVGGGAGSRGCLLTYTYTNNNNNNFKRHSEVDIIEFLWC